MRIIKFVAVLLIAMAVIFPQIASASEIGDNNIDIKNTFSKFLDLLSPTAALADEAPAVTDKEIVADIISGKKSMSEDETRDKAISDEWKEKQSDKWKSLPEGQFVINASAYTASADECGNGKGITASGLKVKEGRTIACPKTFPFGVKIKIEGMGTYTCEDHGGAIKGNKIDIYMLTKKEAFKFGRQNLTAEIVEG
jgi:3D (Asp-Asp-Asp) domain-containing protein